jgi:hypothetical protein
MKGIVEDEGKKARIYGKSIDENPYHDSDTELAHFWENGYLSVKRPRPDNPPTPPV